MPAAEAGLWGAAPTYAVVGTKGASGRTSEQWKFCAAVPAVAAGGRLLSVAAGAACRHLDAPL